jgi:hypothetical protein
MRVQKTVKMINSVLHIHYIISKPFHTYDVIMCFFY